MATPKQEKLIKLLIENYGTKGSTKTLGEMLLEAGYSQDSANNPSLILKGKEVRDGLATIAEQLDEERNRAVGLLKKRISKAKYRDLVDGIDKLTKNHQLLTGKETERVGFSLTELFKKAKTNA